MSKIVLITGGCGGVGYETTRLFARDGYTILWVALLEEELKSGHEKLQSAFPSVSLHYLQKDLSQSSAAQEVFEWVKSNNWKVDVLINNAGFATFGYQQNIPVERETAMIQLNVLNLYQMTRLFLDDFLTRNAGTIINVSSNSSFQPSVRINTYASTKAFVTHFSRGLSEELKMQNSNVRVMTVCPAAIKDTAFKKVAGMEKAKTFSGIAYTTAKEVAKDIYNGYRKGKTFVITGAKMRFLYQVSKLIPYSIQQYVVRKETEELK